jgi:CDP-diacylglycerol--glycerol-3-phosphate 3-phosphatidyltransferase
VSGSGSRVIRFPQGEGRGVTSESQERATAAERADGEGDDHADAAPEQDEVARDASGLPVERFWNLPNTVTMLRIGVVPILLFLPLADGPGGSRFMAWAFILAALTDWLDGYLARRDGGKHVTRIGKLLDPLADKLIVSTALVMLLAVGRIPLWGAVMVVVIIGRELAVTGLRGIASSHGLVVAAAGPGKLKTVAQSAAIGALLFHYETIGLPAHAVGMGLLAIATALTLWSGYLYFAAYFGWQRSTR